MTTIPDWALDIAQEAAVEAIPGLDRLRHDDRFGAWMAGIGLNLCRRLLRDRDWAMFSLDALLQDQMIGEPADTGPGPAEAAEAAEIARRVKNAIRALPAGQRQAAEAYYLSGLTQAEAAAHLGLLHHAHRDRRRPADVDRRRQDRGDGPWPSASAASNFPARRPTSSPPPCWPRPERGCAKSGSPP